MMNYREHVYIGNQPVEMEFSTHQLGSSHILQIRAWQSGQNPYGSAVLEAMVNLADVLKPLHNGFVEMRSQLVQQQNSEMMADLLHKALDFKRSETGVYVPKVNDGDSVIVDRAGQPYAKVLDVKEQVYEKIDKKKLTVSPQSCTCPMQTILSVGCKCGAAASDSKVSDQKPEWGR